MRLIARYPFCSQPLGILPIELTVTREASTRSTVAVEFRNVITSPATAITNTRASERLLIANPPDKTGRAHARMADFARRADMKICCPHRTGSACLEAEKARWSPS